MLNEFSEEELAATEEYVRDDLRLLEARGVLKVEADRFSLCGGGDARLYTKYAARRGGSRKMGSGTTYARRATHTCGDKLGEALVGDEYSHALIIGGGMPHEVGGVQAGQWLEEFCDAARERDLTNLTDLFVFPLDLTQYLTNRDNGLLVCGLLLQIGVEEVEHVELLVNETHLSPEQAEEIGRTWVEEHANLLSKYDIRVLEQRVEVLPADTSANLLVYSQLQVMRQIAFVMYRSGLVQPARSMLAEAVTRAEELLGADMGDPLVRTQFADALSRLAFMSATLKDFREAAELLERADAVAVDVHWLRQFNTAYVAARDGRLKEAVELGELAIGNLTDRDSLVVLHADFGEPSDFDIEHARWNVVALHGNWIRKFLELQVAVWRARADQQRLEDLRREVQTLSRSTPVALLRLAAWAELLTAQRRSKASELFAQAVDAADLDDVPMLRREADSALALPS